MKKLSLFLCLILCLLSLRLAFTADWVAASFVLALAAAVLGDRAAGPAAAAVPLPGWRRYSSLLLLGVSVLLFGVQVGHDLKAKLKKQEAKEATRPQ